MIHKKSFNARIIFSVMVPISILAFFIASLTVDFNQHLDPFDYVTDQIMTKLIDRSRDRRRGCVPVQHIPREAPEDLD